MARLVGSTRRQDDAAAGARPLSIDAQTVDI
jgi:hypothetical protein